MRYGAIISSLDMVNSPRLDSDCLEHCHSLVIVYILFFLFFPFFFSIELHVDTRNMFVTYVV